MHTQEYLKHMDELGIQRAYKTRTLLASEYEVIFEGVKFLNSIYHAVVAFCDVDMVSDDLHKSSRTTMILRVVCTLQTAIALMERGLIADCVSLCRDALEAVFVWKYLERHPEETRRWFDSAYDHKKSFNFAALLDATGDRERIYPLYQSLCKYCHSTGTTFWATIGIKNSDYRLGLQRYCCAQVLAIMREYVSIILTAHRGQLFKDDVLVVQWCERARSTERELVLQYGLDVLTAYNNLARKRGTQA